MNQRDNSAFHSSKYKPPVPKTTDSKYPMTTTAAANNLEFWKKSSTNDLLEPI